MGDLLDFLTAHPPWDTVFVLILLASVVSLVGVTLIAAFRRQPIQLWLFRIGGPKTASVRQEKPPRRKLFVTTPLSAFGTEEKYKEFRESMRTILVSMRRLVWVANVYYFNEDITSLQQFRETRFSVRDYLNELDGSDVFVLIVPNESISSVYFEAGYALAKRKHSIYFVKDEVRIPYLMRQSASTYTRDVRTCEFHTLEEIPRFLDEMLPELE